MEFTEGELTAIFDVLYDQYFYGEELIYQDTDDARNVGTALWKVKDEVKKRLKS